MSQSIDRSARVSLIVGVVGAILTGVVHYAIAASPHFDFLIHDREFYLVLGVVLVIAVLSLLDLKAGFHAVRHWREASRRSAKSLAFAGLTLGVVELLPAALILAVILETFLLRFIQIKDFFQQ